MTTLVDNVLAYQTLDEGGSLLSRTNVMFDAVVAAGVDGAVELIGPGRVQFAVHAPPIEAEVDAGRLATALAHLIADVAGIDATGNARTPATPGYVDSTVVVAAAQRGANVRIEVRGPYSGGDPVHGPIVHGIVRAHGGVLQTHEMPGMSGSAYVLEVPIGTGAGVVPAGGAGVVPDVPGRQAVFPSRRRGPPRLPTTFPPMSPSRAPRPPRPRRLPPRRTRTFPRRPPVEAAGAAGRGGPPGPRRTRSLRAACRAAGSRQQPPPAVRAAGADDPHRRKRPPRAPW